MTHKLTLRLACSMNILMKCIEIKLKVFTLLLQSHFYNGVHCMVWLWIWAYTFLQISESIWKFKTRSPKSLCSIISFLVCRIMSNSFSLLVSLASMTSSSRGLSRKKMIPCSAQRLRQFSVTVSVSTSCMDNDKLSSNIKHLVYIETGLEKVWQ